MKIKELNQTQRMSKVQKDRKAKANKRLPDTQVIEVKF